MFGLGKPRTRFGKKLDRAGINQLELEDATKLSRRTISRLCNDKTYRPKLSTETEIKRGLKKLGEDPSDYFEV